MWGKMSGKPVKPPAIKNRPAAVEFATNFSHAITHAFYDHSCALILYPELLALLAK
jgi:hypothetical protein